MARGSEGEVREGEVGIGPEDSERKGVERFGTVKSSLLNLVPLERYEGEEVEGGVGPAEVKGETGVRGESGK